MNALKEYIYIYLTIIFTVYGQIIIKWRMPVFGDLPIDNNDKIVFFVRVLLDPFVISAFLSAFIASVTWIAALTKFELNYAYPFMGLNFIVVLFLSGFFFDEILSVQRIMGTIIIAIGILVVSRS